MQKNNEKLLRQWLAQTLVDNPDLIHRNKEPVKIYAELQTIWLKEIQDAFKGIISQYKLL